MRRLINCIVCSSLFCSAILLEYVRHLAGGGREAAVLSGKKRELGEASGGARLRKMRAAAPGRGGDARECGGRAAVVAHAQLVQPAQLAHIARLLLLMSVDVRGPVFRMACPEGDIALSFQCKGQ